MKEDKEYKETGHKILALLEGWNTDKAVTLLNSLSKAVYHRSTFN